ncbi:MAG: alcohol dehydrogenase catalytic domain-containing protein, partial [Oscillospiraceae bacterium]|nr:alcohol dehydrogenase catalytic domain-containing protein [Oscillospiraceae bacterium]
GDYDALVKINVCGLCNGTDLRIIEEEVSEHQLLKSYPTVLGHEAAGTVVELGSKVRNISVGEKHVFVRGGRFEGSRYSSTHGQMAEYGLITDLLAMKEDGVDSARTTKINPSRVPDDFDIVDGGIMLPLCECLSAVKNFEIDETTDVLIYGAGPMGLAIMTYMNILGAKSVTAIDSVSERLEKALTIGKVDRVLNFEEVDVAKELDGQLFERVIDAVGLSSILVEGSYHLKPYGRMCSLGVLRKSDALVNLTEVRNNTLIHMLNFPYQEHQCLGENLEYMKQGLIDPKNYYSHVMPMEEVDEAIRLVREKQVLKVILTM